MLRCMYPVPDFDFLAILDCTDNNRYTVDSTGDVGEHTAITIASDGFPFVVYYDVTNGDLKALHASNPWAIPYHRWR